MYMLTKIILSCSQALSKTERVASKAAKADLKTAQRQTAKSLWNNDKANSNMFSVLEA